MDKLPRLRGDIQLIPVQVKDQILYLVQDPMELGDNQALLSPQVLPLLPLFDGVHRVKELKLMLTRLNDGELVSTEEALQVIRDLDGLFMLQSEQYLLRLAQIRSAFSVQAHRPAAHAGQAYPKDAEELAAFIDGILAQASDSTASRHNPKVLVAPHIDPKTGAAVYAQAYAALPAEAPKRILLLGTGHRMDSGLLSASNKTYDTPFGRSPVDQKAVNKITQAAGSWSAEDDFAHRSEHSIEFQMLFLQRRWGCEVPIVPILLGSLREHLDKVSRPKDLAGLGPLIDSLAELAEDSFVVAGVDFSHVGPKFGHSKTATQMEEAFSTHDQALLDALCKGSIEDFWAESKRVTDEFNVCGQPVLALLLEAMPKLRGQVLDYRVHHEGPTRSAVSFAAVSLS